MCTGDCLSLVGILLSILGFGITIGIYYFELKAMLQGILARQKGVLTERQANDLVEIYLGSVRDGMSAAFNRYFDREFEAHVNSSSKEAIHLFLTSSYRNVVGYRRALLTSFLIAGDQSFKDFLGCIDMEPVTASLKEAEENLANLIGHNASDPVTIGNARLMILSKLEDINNAARKLIQAELRKRYMTAM